MRYDTHTIEQCEREIRYADQQLAKTTSADRRRALTVKRAHLEEALQRKRRAAGLPAASAGALEMVITKDGMRVYDEHGQDFAFWPVEKLKGTIVTKVVNAVAAGDRAKVEALAR